MIAIEFECNYCEGKGGRIGLLMDKPHIVCDKCEEIEEIMDIDIVVHCGEVTCEHQNDHSRISGISEKSQA